MAETRRENTKGHQDRAEGAGSESRYARKRDTISGRLDDELVMMDLGLGQYFSLNPSATRIWDLLENAMTSRELCSVLVEEYDVGFEQCLAEVTEYLNEMSELGLIIEIRE